MDDCYPLEPRGATPVVASYHTHGAFSLDNDNELPSGDDMVADGVYGWVATPGGRLWYVATAAMHTRQVCGRNCLPADARFHGGSDGIIAPRYGFSELMRKLAE